MPLSQQQYDEIDEFISSGSKDMNCPAISTRDLIYGKKLYHQIKELPGPSYDIFGSDGCGHHTYSLYKSKTDKIYILSINISFSNKADSNLNISFQYFKLLEDDSWFQV